MSPHSFQGERVPSRSSAGQPSSLAHPVPGHRSSHPHRRRHFHPHVLEDLDSAGGL